MIKMIRTSVVVTTLLTGVHAEFSFGDMFKDMKEAATSMTKDTVTIMNDSIENTSKASKKEEQVNAKASEKKKNTFSKDNVKSSESSKSLASL
ncbi:MAG: Unknown protein [uncultured Sulfurovum sp.]|uniref:Uncharacterized protein n=1 Tax=uncultured Sulfurovum sp. TaxID=269237 RepID=A0A6S6T0X9_9BACT|nr:MAG: Unknown protein [uncultured Sulfurovum sp.]